MRKIKFSKNWNNKLNCDFFTTIRLSTPDKIRYYSQNLDKEFDVYLNNIFYTRAKLIKLDVILLKNISSVLTYLDAGLSYHYFFKLMERMYSKKPVWKGLSSKMIVLLFKNGGMK